MKKEVKEEEPEKEKVKTSWAASEVIILAEKGALSLKSHGYWGSKLPP